MNKIRIIFLSSSDFGAPALIKIAKDSRFGIAALLTLPNKPKGRGLKFQISPIKKSATDLNIQVIEVFNMRDSKLIQEIKNLKPNVMVMASFGKIIPIEILNIVPRGILNIHPSLLPRFRGPSPIQSAILEGEEKTGVTIMLTEEKMDAGPILKSRTSDIQVKKTGYKELYDKLAELAAEMICEVISDWVSGKIKAEPQDESQATYTKKITKENGLIDWNESAKIIERKIRAYEVWPTNYFFFKKNDKLIRVQILAAEVLEDFGSSVSEFWKPDFIKTGEFFESNGDLLVQTGKGILKIIKIKPEGKKQMSGADFLKGYVQFFSQNL